ncbi:MAG: hypothetical protein J5515_04370 [Lachnospiraceae bacterium]|nr:hypothetical protein [Lachnospiraceae bacterium]
MDKADKIKTFLEDEKKQNILLFGVALVMLILWAPLAFTKNVAYDQGYTVAMVRHSFSDIITLCSNDVHSPLYYFIAKIFYHVFLNHIFGLKICSLFFMAFYFWLLAAPFKKEFGFKMSFAMIVLSGFFPTFLTHNTEPRMYAMSVSIFALTVFMAVKILKEFKIFYAVVFFLASLFSTYIHTYTMLATVLLYLVMAVFIVLEKKDRKRKIIWFIANAILVSVSYLPWLFSLMSQFGQKSEGVNTEYDVMYFVNDTIYEFFSSIWYPKKWQVAAWMFILFVSFVLLFAKKSKYIKYILISYAALFILCAIGIILSIKNSPCYLGRYVTCMAPLILFGVAAGIENIKNKWVYLAVLVLSVMAGVLVYRDRVRYEYEDSIDDYIEFAKENIKEDDAILYADLHNDYLSIYYPEAYSLIYGFRDDFNPFSNNETFTDISQLENIKGDVYLICFDNKNPDWFLKCGYEKTYGFHFLYYDFSIYRIFDFE